jgi:hypothetical protein
MRVYLGFLGQRDEGDTSATQISSVTKERFAEDLKVVNKDVQSLSKPPPP